jgi:hypothetical protein
MGILPFRCMPHASAYTWHGYYYYYYYYYYYILTISDLLTMFTCLFDDFDMCV